MKRKYEFKNIVAETLLIPLYMRAKESRRKDAILKDKMAEQLIACIEYDYSKFDGAKLSEVGCVVRGRYFDDAVRRFIDNHSRPIVVNVGCGLDTRCQRIHRENDPTKYYELDLPEVISLRRELIPEPEYDTYISSSLLETKWLECLKTQHPDCDFIFIIEGVLMYFYEEQVKAVLHNIASHFSGGEVQKRSTINSKIHMTPNKKKEGLARLFQIAGERKGLLILSGILSAISALCMLVPYWSIYEILNELLSKAGNLGSIDSDLLIYWGWIAFGGLIIGLILLYASLMASHVAAFRILYGLRVKLSEHIGKLSLGFLSDTSTGAIKKTIEQNIEKIESFIAHTIPDMVNVAVTVIFMFVIFFSLNGWLAAICLACIVLSIGLQYINFMGKTAKTFTANYFDTQERMSASAVQYVRGIPVVKIFGQSVKSFRQFHDEIQGYKKWALKVCDTYEPGMITFTVLLNSIVSLIIPVGLLLISNQPHNIALAAVWLFFIIMGPGVTSPVYKLMFLGGGTREIDEGVKRIDRILDEKPVPETTLPQTPQSYDIEFRDVSFSYESKEQVTRTEALRHISFKASQGEITALVGPSGSGKSTVASLIPRFWDVGEGGIYIGGVDVRNIKTEELMNLISFVFQDTFLFYDTLYENIAVGSPNATREQVEAATRAAQCHEFISNLPDGYDTRIGDKGVFLSGGEAQRICVARAILKNAPILVLDEATAFADPENEYKMQQALQHLIKNKTVIIIAHRLSSIVSAQQIVVLKEGSIAQIGTHQKLSSIPGVYRQMWEAYTDAFQWELKTEYKA